MKLDIEPLNGSTVTIEEAKYMITGSSIETSVLNISYSVEGYQNLFNKPMTSKTSGYLYFQILTTSNSYIKAPTVLELKLKGIDQPISINVIQ